VNQKNPIVFLSDFGLSDPYVGIVKGVIYSINPEADVIDLTHEINPQDVRQAAFILKWSQQHFPPGTIFLAVVDPGVGSSRPGIVAVYRQRLFVGPDNGIFGLFTAKKEKKYCSCFCLRQERIFKLCLKHGFRPGSSTTFHARDIFGPAAALLNLGFRPEDLGEPHDNPVSFSFPEAEVTRDGCIRGQILYFDRFGNAVTNISAGMLQKISCPGSSSPCLLVQDRDISCIPFLETYSQASDNQPFFLIDSFELVEIAVNCGSARNTLGLEVGNKVVVRCK